MGKRASQIRSAITVGDLSNDVAVTGVLRFLLRLVAIELDWIGLRGFRVAFKRGEKPGLKGGIAAFLVEHFTDFLLHQGGNQFLLVS